MSRSADPERDLPSVTVVMPVRNERAAIERSLGAVLAQDYPPDLLEVLVADGMSDDGTREVVHDLAGDGRGVRLKLVDNERRSVAPGLNRAIGLASGDVIVRVDGHCEVPPDYVRRCVDALRATGADNVGGVAAAEGASGIARAIAAAVSSPFGVGNARFRYAAQPGWVDTVPFGTWRRETFDLIGLFDEELVRNQDDEHNFRIIQSGGRIWLDPSIRVVYHSRGSLGSLWRQYYEYGYYKVRVMQKRRGVASARQLVPAAFVGGVAASVLAALVRRRPRLALVVTGPYMVAAALATARADAPREVRSLIPLAFSTMHSAYGVGFLAGVWRYRLHFGSNP